MQSVRGRSTTVAAGEEQLRELSAALPPGRTGAVDRPLHYKLRFSVQRRCGAVGDHAGPCKSLCACSRFYANLIRGSWT